jgi:5-methylcytosine-specific restriction endonuclease McrA
VEDVNRHEIFKRDDYTCQLCSLPIVMSLIFPHRMSSTIDHIVPLAVGGTHEPANVQAAHFACNAAKGARIV